MYLQLYKYGIFLSSRLMGKEIFSLIEEDVKRNNVITLDFSDVKNITMSFGTELIDSIKSVNNLIEIKIINASSFVFSIINFCLSNIRQKEYIPA